MPFVIRTDNNPLMYVLSTPNHDTTEHRWIDTLASFEFDNGVDNGVADTLSRVPIWHNCKTVEGTILGAEANEELLCEHVWLENEA